MEIWLQLRHWGLKNGGHLQKTFSNVFSGNKTHPFLTRISFRLVHESHFNNIIGLILKMAGRRIGEKTLPKLILAIFSRQTLVGLPSPLQSLVLTRFCMAGCCKHHSKKHHSNSQALQIQMETFSALLAICAGNFPAQRTVTRSCDVFFDLRLNKRLSKQSWGCNYVRLWENIERIITWLHCIMFAT